MKIAAGILAGGQARRFEGIAKGLLCDLRGVSILDMQKTAIRQSGIKDIVLLTNDHAAYDSTGIPIVQDLRPGQGPLAGMEVAIEHYRTEFDAVLFIPCDLPGLTVQEIQSLIEAFRQGDAEAVVAETPAGDIQPLCAVLSVSLRTFISKHLDEGQRSVIECLKKQKTIFVKISNERAFRNINTPEDWRQWIFETVD